MERTVLLFPLRYGGFVSDFSAFLAFNMSRWLIILGSLWLGETFYHIKASDWLIFLV